MAKVSALAEIKKLVFSDPNLKPDDIVIKLAEAGVKTTAGTVSATRSDFLNSITVLKELGAITNEVKVPEKKEPKPKQLSRSNRWNNAIADAENGLQELIDLQSEYEEWKDSLPENLENSPVSDKLQEVVDLDIQSVLDSLQEFDGIDLPLGFGRD